MNTVGIVAEYNPFHNGHLYHLEETKKKVNPDAVVAVMSGNFTQRGEPAFLNKWVRAEIAVRNGIDVVIELPFVFACNNAEYFAMGAMGILDGLGCVSHFSFGSEHGNIEELIRVTKVLAFEDDKFKDMLKFQLDKGYSFPKARYETIKILYGTEHANLLLEPNNILAVEYLKQWLRRGSPMKPITVKRKGSGYHESASSIRKQMEKEITAREIQSMVPVETAKVLDRISGNDRICPNNYYNLLAYKVLTTDKKFLSQILSVGEGLENKLRKGIIKSRSMEDILRFMKTKRYTETRLKRLLVHTLMGLTKENYFSIVNDNLLYARVLGISQKGADLLRYIKKQNCASIPILNNINKELSKEDELWKMLHYDILASDIYNLLCYGELYNHSDYIIKLYTPPKEVGDISASL
ncbi:MAG: nucleotidyltransferase [Eubacteriales bacterium]|nr:nucleotidyltransferase [Eubacteriales bacterium]MDD4582566.1 nucleotidyltransferase [Eubacteriales bacterium]